MACFCEHEDQTSNVIKIGEFLDQMNNYDLFKKDHEPWSWLGVTMHYI
jgi:hypothetical protein